MSSFSLVKGAKGMVKYKGSEDNYNTHTLYVPNKFLHPFPIYVRRKGHIHYLLEIRQLKKETVVYTGKTKNIRRLGIVYPSGRIMYSNVYKVKVIQKHLELVIDHNNR